MKKLLKVAGVALVMVIIIRLSFLAGVDYGVEVAGDVYCGELIDTIATLEVNEQSKEFTFNGDEYGEYEGVKYVIVRTK